MSEHRRDANRDAAERARDRACEDQSFASVLTAIPTEDAEGNPQGMAVLPSAPVARLFAVRLAYDMLAADDATPVLQAWICQVLDHDMQAMLNVTMLALSYITEEVFAQGNSDVPEMRGYMAFMAEKFWAMRFDPETQESH